MSFINEDIRLCILRSLDKAKGSLNNAVILVAVRRLGHRVGLDAVTSEMNWLAAQGLVTTEPVDGLIVAAITYKGQDVARGDAAHPGVKQPIPGLE